MQPLALVTGANQGIGLETCRQLKAAWIDVILTGRNEKAGRAAARDLGVAYHPLDVTSATSIAALADWTDDDILSLKKTSGVGKAQVKGLEGEVEKFDEARDAWREYWKGFLEDNPEIRIAPVQKSRATHDGPRGGARQHRP